MTISDGSKSLTNYAHHYRPPPDSLSPDDINCVGQPDIYYFVSTDCSGRLAHLLTDPAVPVSGINLNKEIASATTVKTRH